MGKQKLFKKVISFVCSIAILTSCIPVVFASENTKALEIPKTPELWNTVDFNGTGYYGMVLRNDGCVESTIDLLGTGTGSYYSDPQFQKLFKSDVVGIEVNESSKFVAALKADGTVVVTPPLSNNIGQNNTEEWKNIVQIKTAKDYTLGLNSSGKVLYASIKEVKDVNDWSDIVKIDASSAIVMGLTKSNNVVINVDEKSVLKDAKDWSDIVDISVSDIFAAGVTSDGKVKATKTSLQYEFGSEDWTDIVQVDTYSNSSKGYIVGLKSDGTVYITDSSSPFSVANDTVKTTIDSWTNIQKVFAYSNYVVGITNDNKMVYATNQSASSSVGKFLKAASDVSLEQISPLHVKLSYAVEDGVSQGKVSLSLDEKYTSHKFYVSKDSNPYNPENENENLYRSSLNLNKDFVINETIENDIVTGTTFDLNYVIVKNTKNGNIPSSLLKLSIDSKDIIPKIIPSVTPGVYNPDNVGNSISLDFSIVKDGNKIQGFKIYYRELQNAQDVQESVLYNGKPIVFTDDKKFEVWAENDNIKTEKELFIYSFLNKRPNKYPAPEYDSKYTPEELADKDAGLVVPKRNSMIAHSGSNFSMVLNTNGTVSAGYLNTGSSAAITERKYTCEGQSLKSEPSKWKTSDWTAVPNWRMISDIGSGSAHVVGLKLDGTVIASGNNDETQIDVSNWKDIVDIAVGHNHTVGLKKDGTVISTSPVSQAYDFGQGQLSTWNYSPDKDLSDEENAKLADEQRIIAISTNNNHTVGLRNNGTVVAAGSSTDGETNVDSWTDIVEISAGTTHTVGLKSDGTVVATGNNDNNRCNVEDWKDVISVSAGSSYTLGLTYDGRVLHAGYSCDYFSIDDSSTVEKLKDIGAIWQYTGSSFNAVFKDNAFFTSDISKNNKRIKIFDAIDTLYNSGVRFKSISAGDYMLILIDENGIVYNIIYKEAPSTTVGKPTTTDSAFPRVAQSLSLNGPTVISNYESGIYSHTLNIALDTMSPGYGNLYAIDNTDIWARPTTYTNPIPFESTYLTILPNKNVQNLSYAPVSYYFSFSNPEIVSYPESGDQTGPIDLSLDCSLPTLYTIYYTTDGTDPTTASQAYEGKIHLDKSTAIKARAYSNKDSKVSTPVYSMFFSIPTDGGEIGNGTTVTETSIKSGNVVVWTKSGSPYTLTGSLNIQNGASLYIDPGVEIKVGTNNSITANGNMIVNGTNDQPIKFTSTTDSKWGGITVSCASTNTISEFKNIEITNAKKGITFNTERSRIKGDIENIVVSNCDDGFVISSGSSDYTLKFCSAYNNTQTGFIINGANNSLVGCTSSENNIGMQVTAVDTENTLTTIKNSTIESNLSYGINVSGISINTTVNDSFIANNKINVNTNSGENSNGKILNFQSNYWGTSSEDEINALIIHKDDKRPTIDFSDFMVVKPLPYIEIGQFYDENGNEATLDNVLRYTTLSTTIACPSIQDESILFAFAQYDDNDNLVNVIISENVLTADKLYTDISIDLTLLQKDNSNIKSFVWHSVKTPRPYIINEI